MRGGFTKQIGSFIDVDPVKENTRNTHLFEEGLYSANSAFALRPSPLVRDKHKGIFLLEPFLLANDRTITASLCITNAVKGTKYASEI